MIMNQAKATNAMVDLCLKIAWKPTAGNMTSTGIP